MAYNITYILGNGFDLNFGLKTSYKDFYNYYVDQDSGCEAVERIKDQLREFIKDKNDKEESEINWSDLEIALGEYTAMEESVDQYILLLQDINKHLNKYLKQQNSLFNPSETVIDDLKKDFINPGSYLSLENAKLISEIKTASNAYNDRKTNISIVTFNYTDVVEKISPSSLNATNQGNIFNDIYHVHAGMGNAILGVDDVTQIVNENFRKESALVDRLVKPIINGEERARVRDRIRNTILYSNLIVVFGASLGPSDRVWASLIGEQMVSNKSTHLLYYTLEDEADTSTSTERAYLSRKFKNVLYHRMGLTTQLDVDSVKNRIFIGCNTELFKGYKVNQTNETLLLPNYTELTVNK